jgi:hypothetical protein
LDSIARSLKIHDLKAQMEFSRLRCASLVRQFNAAQTPEQKNMLSGRWDRAVRENQFLQCRLEVLEQEEQEHSILSAMEAEIRA